MPAANTIDEFWARIDRSGGEDACWPWTAWVNRHRGGYGHFSLHCRRWKSHRLAYKLTKGDPSGWDVLHKCDNPKCCNPAHLYLGTDADNANDRVVRQTRKYKLTIQQVAEIKRRLRAGEIPPRIAGDYGVKPITIYAIRYGRNWGHVA